MGWREADSHDATKDGIKGKTRVSSRGIFVCGARGGKGRDRGGLRTGAEVDQGRFSGEWALTGEIRLAVRVTGC